MIEESKFSLERIVTVLGTIALYVIGILILFLRNEVLIDEILCLSIITGSFFIVFVLSLVIRRLNGTYYGSNYKRVFIMHLLCWALIIGFSFAPKYFMPFVLIGLLLNSILDDGLAIGATCYLAVIYTIIQGLNLYYLYGYILISILGILLSNAMKSDFRIPKIYLFVVTFAINLCVSIAFSYLALQKITKSVYLVMFCESIFVAFFMLVIFPSILKWIDQQNTAAYEELLELEHPLLQDIKRFSNAEYRHAIRVSRLARSCTVEIRGNDLAAACAGMYYRLGKILGKPEIQNAIKTANDHCFPKEVVSILAEYGGIIKKPQTQESAIVHMCDVVVTKMELLSENESMRSNWNQDMVIYQTLNEYSQRGFYDESGLSINQFLLVRERMIREESIL